MSLTDEVLAEFGKVKDVLRTVVGKLHLPSETEIQDLATAVEAIAEPETAPENTDQAQTASETVAPPGNAAATSDTSNVDPLAGFSVEQLQAELAARQDVGT